MEGGGLGGRDRRQAETKILKYMNVCQKAVDDGVSEPWQYQ